MDEIINEDSQLSQVLEILGKIKPESNLARHCPGSGCASESIFSFSHCGNYYWIVIICDSGTFAFKHISPDWIRTYANLILSSTAVCVEWNMNHYITDWTVEQDKFCGDNADRKMVRAV